MEKHELFAENAETVMVQHHCYAMRFLEKLSIHTFQTELQKLQGEFGMPIQFKIEIEKPSGISESRDVPAQVIPAYTCFLPVLMATDMRETFKAVFPYVEYPIALAHHPDAIFNYAPVIKGETIPSHFSALAMMASYTVERFLHNGYVHALMPLTAKANLDYYPLVDKALNAKLVEIIREHPHLEQVDISLNPHREKLERVLSGHYLHQSMTEVDDDYSPIIHNASTLAEEIARAFHEQNMMRSGGSMEILNVPFESAPSFPKPDIPFSVRFGQYEKDMQQQRLEKLGQAATGHSLNNRI